MDSLRRWAKAKAVQALGWGLASVLLTLGAYRLGWLDTLENKSLDWRFRTFTQPGRASKDIVIIALDDVSFDTPGMLDNFGRWPWRRALYAGLVNYLHEWGARAIGIDLFFQGADPHAGDDNDFSGALAERPDVVLGFTLNRGKVNLEDPRAREKLRQRLAPLALQVDQQDSLDLQPYKGVDLPLDQLLRAVPSIGCATVEFDPDGPVRWVTPLFRYEGNLYPSFPVAVASLATRGAAKQKLTLTHGPVLDFAGRRLPVDREGRMVIRWYGIAWRDEKHFTFRNYSVWKVFNSALAYENGKTPEIPPTAFKDKIVLIGPTAEGIGDTRPNAFSERYPGVEIHATAISNLLQGDFLRTSPRSVAFVAVFGMAFLLAAVVYLFRSAFLYTVLGLGGGLAYSAAACALFRYSDLWVPMMAPLVSGALAFTGSTLTRYATEGREKRKYRKTLLKYLSPQLVETIMADFNWASLRAEKRRLTVLFSDVRGFTTFSEKYPAETVIATLNEHLNMMVSVIFKWQGTLDKFVGDCVMAFWGAPLVQPNHAGLACRAALEMIEGLENLNRKWQSEGRPTLKIGVGINTGEMLFGNIGSEQRMDFTVIGDSVNLGARLESATKELHASIVISDATYQQIRPVAQVRPLGEIHVKGKEQGILVYELLGMAGAVPLKEAAS
jgi:adenylate cyclase